jgi:outer membrane lipoprotein SlyB
MAAKAGLSCLFFILTTACASGTAGPSSGIIIDSKGVDRVQYRIDLADCQQYAQQVAIGRRTVTNAAGGAAIGGVLGAVVGDSDTAKKGAGVGAVTGGVRGAASAARERRQVVRNCLLGRGYRVLN